MASSVCSSSLMMSLWLVMVATLHASKQVFLEEEGSSSVYDICHFKAHQDIFIMITSRLLFILHYFDNIKSATTVYSLTHAQLKHFHSSNTSIRINQNG